MAKRWVKIVLPLLILSLAGVVLCRWYIHDDHDHREEMIKITLEWGRLAPFPSSAREVTIRTEGSMFTRAFRTHFVAPPKDVDAWLAASPGIGDAQKQSLGPGKWKYIIKPGGGAGWAEVTVDEQSGTVDVYVYWS